MLVALSILSLVGVAITQFPFLLGSLKMASSVRVYWPYHKTLMVSFILALLSIACLGLSAVFLMIGGQVLGVGKFLYILSAFLIIPVIFMVYINWIDINEKVPIETYLTFSIGVLILFTLSILALPKPSVEDKRSYDTSHYTGSTGRSFTITGGTSWHEHLVAPKPVTVRTTPIHLVSTVGGSLTVITLSKS